MQNLPSEESAVIAPVPLDLLAPLTREELAIAEALIGHRFARPEWLALALTHSSATNASGLNNERIEFLGDSILGLVVAEHLLRTKPAAPEGELTRYRSMLVNTETLAQVMRSMVAFMLEEEYRQAFGESRGGHGGGAGLYGGGESHGSVHGGHATHGTHAGHGGGATEDGRLLKRVSMRSLLRLGRGIPANKELPSRIWANMFEAIVGAIYMDAGLTEARHFVLRILESTLLSVTSPGVETNHKSLLQHITQKFLGGSVRYVVAGQTGPDHEKIFEIQVKVQDHVFASARGKSKREAEQASAYLALAALADRWDEFVVNGLARPAELALYQMAGQREGGEGGEAPASAGAEAELPLAAGAPGLYRDQAGGGGAMPLVRLAAVPVARGAGKPVSGEGLAAETVGKGERIKEKKKRRRKKRKDSPGAAERESAEL